MDTTRTSSTNMQQPDTSSEEIVVFQADLADLQRMGALVIKATTGEDVDPAVLTDPCNLTTWRGQQVNLLIIQRDDFYELIHTKKTHRTNPPFFDRLRPWHKVYPTAGALVRAANLKVIHVSSYTYR